MFFPRFIRWLSGLPAAYALGLLWWGEITILLCSLAGGYLLSVYLFDNLTGSRQNYLFILAILTYLVVFYFGHFTFAKNSQLMEALLHIHRLGGVARIEKLALDEQNMLLKDTSETVKKFYPFAPPERIRASAGAFRIRYFIVLPTFIFLYLLGFTSTIYRIFTHQILSWEPGYLVLPALASAIVGCLCFGFLMPALPGYVSVRGLLGQKTQEGE
jgi:hypothetical protein